MILHTIVPHCKLCNAFTSWTRRPANARTQPTAETRPMSGQTKRKSIAFGLGLIGLPALLGGAPEEDEWTAAEVPDGDQISLALARPPS